MSAPERGPSGRDGAGAGYQLVRVDDRLLHGQVAFGWGRVLAPRRYLIVDDRAHEDPWEREAFLGAAPEETEVAVIGEEAFAAVADRTDPEAGRTVVLLRGVAQLEGLWSRGFRPAGGVNLGGLHARAGTRELLPYVHLTRGECAALVRMLDDGLRAWAQALPGDPRVEGRELRDLLEAGSTAP